MSDCERVRALIEDAVHGRLDPRDRSVVTSHLARCPSCTTLHDAVDRQRAVVAAFAPRAAPPRELRSAVLQRLRRRRRTWLLPALGGALAATLVLAAALALVPGVTGPARAPLPFQVLLREAVDDHIRVVLRQRAGPSAPRDLPAVHALMGKVLDYPVPRPAAGDGAFRLAGGRPSYVMGRPVACFYYESPSAYASLFVLPLDRLGDAARAFAERPSVTQRDGRRMAYWARAGYAYFVVSEAPADAVMALATALRPA